MDIQKNDNLLQLSLGDSHVGIRLDEGCRLIALASALEYGLIWLTGKGVWRFEARRQGQVITLDTLAQTPTRRQAGSGRLADVSPSVFPAGELWGMDQFQRGESIVQCSISKPDVTIGEYSFWVSEALMTLLLIGSTLIKHQCDTEKFQMIFDVELPDNEARGRLLDSYDPSELVADAIRRADSLSGVGIRDGQHRCKGVKNSNSQPKFRWAKDDKA
jgi:hypothetical protein